MSGRVPSTKSSFDFLPAAFDVVGCESTNGVEAVDLKTYEQIKFALAELVRSGQLIATERETDSKKKHDAEQPWRNLLARLADDRFTVVFAGRFNRGKSSLMNALLGMDRLPTGVVPLTSVITYVRYGTSERVLLDYQGSGLRGEARLDELPDYVTEKGNPANVKRLRSAEIQLPSEILRRGVFLVDTPGLGSAIFENTKTTESFIPEIDVLILVTSYESPLTDDEIRYLQQASSYVRAVFVVVNKQDTVPVETRKEVLDFVTDSTKSLFNGSNAKPFSVSARDGLRAKQTSEEDLLRSSGIQEFETELVQFLTAYRTELFLVRMCDRVLGQLESLPETDGAAVLTSKLKEVRRQIGDLAGDSQRQASPVTVQMPRARIDARGVTPCEICRSVLHDVLDFMRQYQYDLSTSPETQDVHARQGGFCPQHTWHYEQIASPRGVCTAYPRLLNLVAKSLRMRAESANSDTETTVLRYSCPACTVRWATEDRMVDSFARKMQSSSEGQQSTLCLPHLGMVLPKIDQASVRRTLLLREAAVMERTAEDMQRYAIKHDGLRRHLVSKEENDAPLLGLQILVGHRNVNAIFTLRDIL